MMIGTYRSPVVVLLLSVLTCGLYYFYFMYVVTEEVNRYTGRNEQSPLGDVVLTIVTCGLWDILWDYKIGKRMADMTRMAGITVTDNAIFYLILDLVGLGFINAYMQQDTLNRVWSARPPYSSGGGYQDPGAYPPPPGPYYR